MLITLRIRARNLEKFFLKGAYDSIWLTVGELRAEKNAYKQTQGRTEYRAASNVFDCLQKMSHPLSCQYLCGAGRDS
jgi:hypothetical protein